VDLVLKDPWVDEDKRTVVLEHIVRLKNAFNSIARAGVQGVVPVKEECDRHDVKAQNVSQQAGSSCSSEHSFVTQVRNQA
jgi:hypothetical protein